MEKQELYVKLWKSKLPLIKAVIIEKKGNVQLSPSEFINVGNRKKYSFRLDMVNPKISSSAVARDLKSVLENDKEIKSMILDKHLIIRMGSDFKLSINIYDK